MLRWLPSPAWYSPFRGTAERSRRSSRGATLVINYFTAAVSIARYSLRNKPRAETIRINDTDIRVTIYRRNCRGIAHRTAAGLLAGFYLGYGVRREMVGKGNVETSPTRNSKYTAGLSAEAGERVEEETTATAASSWYILALAASSRDPGPRTFRFIDSFTIPFRSSVRPLHSARGYTSSRALAVIYSIYMREENRAPLPIRLLTGPSVTILGSSRTCRLDAIDI